MPWEEFIAGNEAWRADPALARELKDLLADTPDKLPDE